MEKYVKKEEEIIMKKIGKEIKRSICRYREDDGVN